MHPRSPEHRRAYHDGYVWPFLRADMRDAQPIRERMVEDIATLLRREGPKFMVVAEDLLGCGWTQAQVDAHAAVAFCHHRVLTQPRPLHARRDTPVRIAVEIAALAAFILPVLVLAGHFSGRF